MVMRSNMQVILNTLILIALVMAYELYTTMDKKD